jgi:hypothetical protein
LNRILKVGLIALCASVGCFLLLMLLSALGVVSAGPCGFDPLGWVLFFGFLVGGGVGILLTAIGLLQKAFRRVHS